MSFRRGGGHLDGPTDGRLVQPDSEKADVCQKGIRACVLVSKKETAKKNKKEKRDFSYKPASVRARTQQLEQQQPGVEGELRRLLEKPGKAEFANARLYQPVSPPVKSL